MNCLGVRLVLLPQQGPHELLHQVDEEEACTDHELRETLQLYLLRPLLQAVGDLRHHVEHRGSQQDPTTQARQKRRYYNLSSAEARHSLTEIQWSYRWTLASSCVMSPQ